MHEPGESWGSLGEGPQSKLGVQDKTRVANAWLET